MNGDDGVNMSPGNGDATAGTNAPRRARRWRHRGNRGRGRGIMRGRFIAQADQEAPRGARLFPGAPLSIHERLTIIHHIYDYRTLHGADPPYTLVGNEFGHHRTTISEIWERRDSIVPHRPGPRPAPVVIPPRDENDSLINVLFHPPRKDDLLQTTSPATQVENKEDASPAATAGPVGQEETKEVASSETAAAATARDRTPLRTTLVQGAQDAQNTLIVAVFSFTEDMLGQAILGAADRGVKIKIYLDHGQAYKSPKWPRKFIESNKIEINYRRARSEKMHMKYLVADGNDVCVGSANFSAAALVKYNEEVLLHLRGRRAASFFEEDFSYRWKTSKCLLKSKLARPTL